MLQHTPSVRHLEIRVSLEQYTKRTHWRYHSAVDRAKASDDIVDRIFKNALAGVDTRSPLRSLQVYELDLSTAQVNLRKAVDTSRLQSLGLQKCWHAIDLLRGIRPTGLPLRMSMHSLSVIGRMYDKEERIDNAIDDLLLSFCGLEPLVIAGPSQEAHRPALTSIANHVATLRHLYLDCV